MKPRLLIGLILGGGSAVLFWNITGAGLVAGPAPGSIFAYLAVTPPGGVLIVPLGIIIATGVSFFVNTMLLKTAGEKVEVDGTAVARHPLLFAVELDVADGQHGRNPLRVSAAQQRAHTRKQFSEVERFRQIVVSAQF